MGYESLGLDNTLTAVNAVKMEPLTSSFDVRTGMVSNAIGNTKIQNLSFDKISGGTALLGGLDNGNGELVVNNAGGTEIVRIDEDGIVVSEGSIQIQNSAGTTIMDANGLVSTANFQFGQGSAVNTQQTTSTSYVDITDGSVQVVLSRQTNVLISYLMAGYHLDFDGMVLGRVIDNGTAIGPSMQFHGEGPDSGGDASETHSASFMQLLDSGTHTLKVQFRQNNIGGTAILTKNESNVHTLVNYLVLGN